METGDFANSVCSLLREEDRVLDDEQNRRKESRVEEL